MTRKLTAAERKAAYYAPPDEDPDARAATLWHEARRLSPRQRAGFFEVPPAQYPAAIRAYRARVRAITACAKWLRANPAPTGRHVGIGWGSLGSFATIRAGGLSEEWARYRTEAAVWDQLSAAKKKKTASPPMPKGDQEIVHDASFMYYARASQDTCPACQGFDAEAAAWIERRIAAYAKFGITFEQHGSRNFPRSPGLWPDGAWEGELDYPPLPIRSAKAVERIAPKEVKPKKAA